MNNIIRFVGLLMSSFGIVLSLISSYQFSQIDNFKKLFFAALIGVLNVFALLFFVDNKFYTKNDTN
ncbi:hypothetical protein [Tepidibacter hydrothermalis]|uniref:Uncharacterized protein n=1 Tax=Tepidibacter hydrothermalis TaxID=3036126 RepID=A0ABY8EFA1_9FIRM|nr:hypothetical protein [Tepidibacter hydrothermalis]WFD11632.1 hypothetical protein P4S50_06035 [Tepidibacter hydrothermalis]